MDNEYHHELFQKKIESPPTFTPMLVPNELPHKFVNDAIWKRTKIIPFKSKYDNTK